MYHIILRISPERCLCSNNRSCTCPAICGDRTGKIVTCTSMELFDFYQKQNYKPMCKECLKDENINLELFKRL